jgi:gentisate 1,2-dioxygenase
MAEPNGRSLWDELIELRDAERDRLAKATMVVDGEKAPLETTPMGLIRWYTHPNLQEPAIRTYTLWVQEIPPGSRSGRMQHQGGRLHYVWKGQGHTIIDGVMYDWVADDVICLPIKADGVIFQHFNTGGEMVKLITAELNMVSAMGVDMGVAFEVLEPAPEYRRVR